MKKIKHKKILILFCFFVLIILIGISLLKMGEPSYVPQNKEDYTQFKKHIESLSYWDIFKEFFTYDKQQQEQINNFFGNLSEEEKDEIFEIFLEKWNRTGIPVKNLFSNINYFSPLIFLVITIILWLIFGKDKKIIETVEFYPPKEINSLEAGFLYKGYINTIDISSLLVYLANKGYLTVAKINQPNNDFGFKIVKLKEYDGQNSIEKDFLTLLFQNENGDPINEVIVDEKNLNSINNQISITNFTTRFIPLITQINSKKNRNRLFHKSKTYTMAIVKIFIFLSIFNIISLPLKTYGQEDKISIAWLFTIGYALIATILFSKNDVSVSYTQNQRPTTYNLKSKIIACLIISTFTIIPTMFILFPALFANPQYLLHFFIGLTCIILMTYFHSILPKRTDYYLKMVAKLNGFKHFLETAEKDRMDMLIQENSKYFYDIFPYAFVLGLTNLWNGKYNDIVNKLPISFSHETYSIVDIGAFMTLLNEKNKKDKTSHLY